jgi:hypothetical protein
LCQVILVAERGLPNVTWLLLFVLSIPVCNAYKEQFFQIINSYWRNKCNKSSENLISEIAVKINYKYTSKDFCIFVVKENRSSKQQTKIFSSPKLIKLKIFILITHKMQYYISLLGVHQFLLSAFCWLNKVF